jgi:hypothetical protein
MKNPTIARLRQLGNVLPQLQSPITAITGKCSEIKYFNKILRPQQTNVHRLQMKMSIYNYTGDVQLGDVTPARLAPR